MQVKNINVQELLNRLREYFQENDHTRKFSDEAPPLRAELYNTEQLEQHGKYLAGLHRLRKGHAKERLLKRLSNNEKILMEVRNLLMEATREDHTVSPAGEWLLDNFYLIEDHMGTGKKHLPKGYSEALPNLSNTASEGLPRVYDIALELIAHTDGRIDMESLYAFVNAYQSVTTLQLGELWAIPIVLRLALIENLRRVAVRVALDRVNRNLANYWTDLLRQTSEKDPKSLILVIADMARSGPPMESSFVAEMIRQLMWMGPGLSLPLSWMEQRLSENGMTSNELVNIETQKLAADQVSVSNSIGSLRFLGFIEWHKFVEQISVVEQTLRRDPGGIYPAMDFATRDRYRHVIERIAKYSPISENDVAGVAIRFAEENAAKNVTDKRTWHVGYYLIGKGLTQTEKQVKMSLPAKDRPRKMVMDHPLLFYAGSITSISLLLCWWMVTRGQTLSLNHWVVAGIAVLALGGASQFAIALVNWLTTMMIAPDLLPRLDFTEGIPEEYAAMVIVPTMLTTGHQVETIVEALEVRFLANRDEHLYFGLLTDFPDALDQISEHDDRVLQLAKRRIGELNDKYYPGESRFFLFHRPRKWNSHDKVWMGYERKRGKLTELNELLRGRGADNFSVVSGDISSLPRIRYIITLDTDTQLPRDAGRKLVGAMAHPLNAPVYDESRRRIVEGYGILQPRVSVSLSRESTSLYAQMHGNEPGIDPYTRLTSDVYQDLFHEGSFIGKGIYDVDAFITALTDRFPENRILSHDLLEGCYARSGLVSDIQFYEEYPSRYSADVNRRHRWIRGDWQIAYWATPFVPNAAHRPGRNPLSSLSRWKIFDNLRRSLVPAALTALLLLGWIVLQPWFWTLMVAVIVMIMPVISFLWNIFRKPYDLTLNQHVRQTSSGLADGLMQTGLVFIFLPYEAAYSMTAIFRTVWRMLITHKRLLEWVPSGNQEHTSDRTIVAAYKAMWVSPFLALAAFFFLLLHYPLALISAAPVIILWTLSPFIAWWISNPGTKYEASLSVSQIQFLRKVARKTWAFFEQFVGPEDNWLPPDNYQERPGNVIAHRTSPTNIGLALLSNLAAFDFGFIPVNTLIRRSANTINTMKNMERHQKHLYNWYDTVTLRPLHPRYISTVDSGNMAGHLLTFRQGLLMLPTEKLLRKELLAGLSDTVQVLEEELYKSESLKKFKDHLNSAVDLGELGTNDLKQHAEELVAIAEEIKNELEGQNVPNARWWAEALYNQCTDIVSSIQHLFPWIFSDLPPQQFRNVYEMAAAENLKGLATLHLKIFPEIEAIRQQSTTNDEKKWLDQFQMQIMDAAAFATEQLITTAHLAEQCLDFADLEYDLLYDKSKHLLAIGYNVEDHRKDAGYYDLLASEASLCNFISIAQGKLPQESWFALGRLLTNAGGEPILLSWSGSMFEYLMPLLVMPTYENTLIHQTRQAAVARQIAYGNERNVPWGISESGYNAFDASLNYQYHAFGVPGLGLKRGLADDLVIAPYASVLALMVSPEEACSNIERLYKDGFSGRYGMYEAVDYTVSRLPRGHSHAVIQSFMSHHQGMSMLALAYSILDKPMQKRFEAELQFEATMLLLQERVPRTANFYTHATEVSSAAASQSSTETRVIKTPHTPIPEVQLLSNGKYHVMVTNSGGGYSRWKDLAVTRWREDVTCDNWGSFCYIRDVEDGTFWSNTYQPTQKLPKKYEVTFTQGRAEFRRTDNNIETHTEIVVSPEDDIEIRRVHITNNSRRKRIIEITSYCEVVISSAAADAIHPAFSNLFIQSEILEQRRAILCTRRARSEHERPPWFFHMMTQHGGELGKVSYETDRMKFIGRRRTTTDPIALMEDTPLSNSQGPVLDPIAAIRYQVTIEPDEEVVIDMITGAAETRELCHSLVEKYQDKHNKDRVFELSWTHSQVVLRQINATEADAQVYGQLAASVIFNNQAFRADPATIIKNQRGQSGLWGYSVSGDLPIVLLEICDQSNIELVRQMVQAHAYWRLKGLASDLVIWNDDHGGYRQVLQNMIVGLISNVAGTELTDQPGGIFIRSADQISNEDRLLFQAVARINISDKRGSLEEHLNRRSTPKNAIPYLATTNGIAAAGTPLPRPADLIFFNGRGGYMPGGKEYCIYTTAGETTPAPWINVIANPEFGTIISESGQSYTWSLNAHEFRLTPWENDPVSDKGGEAFYLRDEESGQFWSPCPLPATSASPYITRHGFGYSIFEHREDGIYSEMTVFVDLEDAVKFTVLKVKNTSARPRKISVTGYVDWVLGDLKPKTGMHIISETDAGSGALLARNAYNKEFDGLTAFFDTDETSRTFTADRTEFLGRNGSLKNPDGMSRSRLSGKSGAGLDPCAAIQSSFTLNTDQEREVVFRLGCGKNVEDARSLVTKYKSIKAQEVLKTVRNYWDDALSAVQVETPNQSLNMLTNGWLLYQTIVCRLWARSGYYQSGGAFGFRDQLQDVLAIINTQPQMARKQIVLCASRQFKEGDVQHWWHPPMGRGVRTRCSDDLLWLPYVTSIYIQKTGDIGILDESIQYLESRPLNVGESSYYDLPVNSNEFASLYQHCVRAITRGSGFGERGLPLIGAGDWNDGMDDVGKDGKGESVWLAFFLYDVLMRFITVAREHGDAAFEERCRREARQLQGNIEDHAWDGGWYRRAYFDDGTPLGSKDNVECSIDSISQSWAIISGAGDPERTTKALAAADKRLVRPDLQLIQLLDPPFDKSTLNPGYIKGYVPGIRENGGQYTHAAVWMVMAYAALGDSKRAWELMDMINPINHSNTPEAMAVYKTEPYVVAADVYSISQNRGRGGWTWYTGSAGWMYQLITEWLLGLRREDNRLVFSPCIPNEWPSFKVNYRFGETVYNITITQKANVRRTINVVLDGVEQPDNSISMVNDKAEHVVEVRLAVNEVPHQHDA